MRMAVTSLRIESVFGKSPATFVRRFICVLRVSHMLDVRRRFRLCSGRLKMVNPSGIAESIQALRRGAVLAYFSMSRLRRSSARARESALKIVRMSEATASRISTFGTYAWAFCWRWYWQRCQGLALKTALSAALRP